MLVFILLQKKQFQYLQSAFKLTVSFRRSLKGKVLVLEQDEFI